MLDNQIGNVARKLYEKLANSLAGPLEKFLPAAWVQEALAGVGHKFRNTAFSPSGHFVGLDRADPRQRQGLQQSGRPSQRAPRFSRARAGLQ